MNETFESNIESRSTATICEKLVTELEDLNMSIGISLKNAASQEVANTMGQVKNKVYPCLVAAREIQRRQKAAAGRAR